jgi:hypothetical protein
VLHYITFLLFFKLNLNIFFRQKTPWRAIDKRPKIVHNKTLKMIKGVSIMKKMIAVCLFILITGVCLHAQTFSWDIKFLKVEAAESVPISRTIAMETKDRFRIIITPDSYCFCYVALYDSDGEITVLYDKPLQRNEIKGLGPFVLEGPSGTEKTTKKMTERIYVIMSREQQTELEGLIMNFNRSPSKDNNDKLYTKLQNLQKTINQLGNPASSFIASASTTRAPMADKNTTPPPPKKDEYVTRFSGKDRYVRTITISH